MKTARPALLFASLLASLITLSACSEKPAETKTGPPPALITVTQAQAMLLEVIEQTLGSLEAVNDPKIAAEVAARIVKITVRAGQPVKKGQLLAELDTQDAGNQHSADRAEIARIESLLAQQNRVVTRQNELVAKNFISKNASDDATAQRDALKSQLAAARARSGISGNAVSKARVIAPFDGVIEEQIASAGDYLKIGDPIFRLVSNARLRAHLPFPESAGQRLMRGQPVRLTSPLSPGVIIEGEVEDIRPTLSETSRSIDVIARFDNPAGAGELRGGGSVDASVVIGSKESAVMVPEQSVVLRPAGKVVYVIVDGKAEQRKVEAGTRQKGKIEIIKGIAAGDTIALDGAGFLSNGAAVSIQERNKPASPAAKPAEAAK